MPSSGAADVQAVSDALAQALLEGDKELANDPFEHKLLAAIVAEAGQQTATWAATRLPGGVAAVAPLEQLVPYLQRGDVVGKSLATIREKIVSEAKVTVASVVTAGTWPVWVGSVIAFFGGVFGFTYNFGGQVGTGVAALLAGAVVPAGFVVYGLRNGAKVVSGIGPAAASVLTAIDSMGVRATGVFNEHARPAIESLYGSVGARMSNLTVVAQVRGGSKSVVIAAYVVAAVCIVFFLSGVYDGYSRYQDLPICGLVPTDGTCRPA